MPDVPFPKPEPPTRREVTASRLSGAFDSLARLVRLTLTGYSEKRSIRRTVLFLIAADGIGIAMSTGGGAIPLSCALIAVLLLALTDQVVEL